MPEDRGYGARHFGGVVIGDGTDPNNSVTQDVQLLLARRVDSPASQILQHLVAYTFYTGTPDAGAGTLHGGSSESKGYMSAADWSPNGLLGFEGIGNIDGANSRRVSYVIGVQGSAWAKGTINVTKLVSLRASAPRDIGGTPTVDEAISLEVHKPSIGATRYAIKSAGEARFAEGDVDVATAGKGVVLTSPNGTRYRLTVADDGTLSTTAI